LRDATLISDKIIALVTQLQLEIAEIQEDESTDEFSSIEDDIRGDEERKRLWALIEPALKRLTDRRRLVDILTGARLPRADGKRLRELLRELRDGVQLRLADAPQLEKAMKDRAAAKEASLAWTPQPLMLLQDYVSRIERSIKRKLDQFSAT